MVKNNTLLAFVVILMVSLLPIGHIGQAAAADVKVAVLDMQKVLAESEAGKKAQATLKKKGDELQAGFKKEQDALKALQEEMKKKGSAWSEDMKKQKAMEYQKMGRDMQNKQEDANLEFNKLREEVLSPILKTLEQVVKDTAKAKGYTLVLPHNTLLYFADEVDITSEMITALNAKVK